MQWLASTLTQDGDFYLILPRLPDKHVELLHIARLEVVYCQDFVSLVEEADGLRLSSPARHTWLPVYLCECEMVLQI